jgi:hypothetical protein
MSDKTKFKITETVMPVAGVYRCCFVGVVNDPDEEIDLFTHRKCKHCGRDWVLESRMGRAEWASA